MINIFKVVYLNAHFIKKPESWHLLAGLYGLIIIAGIIYRILNA